MTSGTRKPPPISTSSPREMITSRPAASAASTSSVAAALLLTTTAASAPVSRQSSRSACTSRRPRVAARRGRIRDWCSRARAPRRVRPRRAPSGARPRLVWMIDAGRVDDAAQRRRRAGGEPRRHGLLERADHIVVGRRVTAPAAGGRALPERRRLGAERLDERGAAVLRFERAHGRALAQLFDGRDGAHGCRLDVRAAMMRPRDGRAHVRHGPAAAASRFCRSRFAARRCVSGYHFDSR